MQRRRFCSAAALLPLLAAVPLRAHAGRQAEEPLADSVRTALSSAIANSAPPVPVFRDTASRMHYLRWLATMSDRLAKRMPDFNTRVEFLQTVWYESKRAGLETSLVLGLIQVESAFRKYAVSYVGARGYMQIMPFWSRVIGDAATCSWRWGATTARAGARPTPTPSLPRSRAGCLTTAPPKPLPTLPPRPLLRLLLRHLLSLRQLPLPK